MERTICAVSGTEPSQWCRGGQRTEIFVVDQPPLPASQDLLRRSNIDTWTGLLANDLCKEFVEDELVMNVSDRWGREWLRSGAGRDWLEAHDLPRNPFFAPERECNGNDPRPVIEFTNLNNSSVITETTLPIQAMFDVANGSLTGWRLEYGLGPDPAEWTLLTQGTAPVPTSTLITNWNLEGIQEPQITLRIYLMNGEEFHAERRVTVTLNLPTPTPSPTPTETPTQIPPTAFPTDTSLPVVPSETPTEFPTEVPTATPE
jgi:hypothetical protein